MLTLFGGTIIRRPRLITKASMVSFVWTFLAVCLSTSVSAAPQKSIGLSASEVKWLEQHKTVSVAFDQDFPPYSFVNERDELEGFSVDVLKLLAHKLDITLDIREPKDWNTLFQTAIEKRVDVVAAMVQRDERNQWFAFTRPYILKSLVVITQDSNTTISHRDDVAGKTIALVKGYQYVDQILKNYPDIKPLYFETIRDAFLAVSLGEADAAISFLGAGHYYRNKYLMTNLKYSAIYDRNNANESISVRGDWPELAVILEKAFKFIPEAKLLELRERWLPVDFLDSVVELNLTNKEREWIKAHPRVRVGVDPEFAPFEFIDKGEYQGIASDYIRILSQRLNLKWR